MNMLETNINQQWLVIALHLGENKQSKQHQKWWHSQQVEGHLQEDQESPEIQKPCHGQNWTRTKMTENLSVGLIVDAKVIVCWLHCMQVSH